MLIQSWGRKIRIFPAIPDSWDDAVFHNLRAEGAFLVSAVRKNGKTAFVNLKSLAGEPCILKTDFSGPLSLVSDNSVEYKILEKDGEYEIFLGKGEEVTIYPSGAKPDLLIEPLRAQPGRMNCYGLNY